MTPKGTTAGSVKGFLDVKIPARKRKSISLFRVQVWKRRCWVVIRGDRSPEDGAGRTGQLSLSVEIYTRHEGSNHPTEGTILHLDLVHRIRRAKSKSHPYAFEVCGRRGEALLYLSGQSETETQRWMAEMRNILWPPNHLDAISRSHGPTWEVSAISVGEAGSDWTSLAGLYGRLAVREANLLIKDVHNGTTRVEWPLTSVQRVCVATGGEVEDEGKIFIIQTRPCHPCGEAYLYFFSPELSELLEGLHEAVSELISASAADDISLISDLSELSGALSSVVVLPQRLPDPPKMRKSTSVIDLAQIHELQPLCNVHTPARLSSSQCNLAEEIRGEPPLPGRLLGHSRRRSMSETNLAKLCLDETDEELESRDDDLEDADLRQTDLPKDRTSSSGSYNSYRSTDSGVRLSASPSTHCEGGRYMSENTTRRFVTKSDSLDSGVRACLKEGDTTIEGDEGKKVDTTTTENKQEPAVRRGMSALEEEPDVDTKVGAWCLQSARARKSFFTKNLSVSCSHPKDRKTRTLNRTMSESYKEVADKHDEYRRKSELPGMATVGKTCTVYEEIVDVLKPLSAANQQSKEHDYEELDKCRRDIKRSYSFQEKSKPPPLPPRRPKSFSPDPWAEEALSKSGALRKIFGLSFHSKSHSTESMLDVERTGFDDITNLGSDDVAMVQALGTLPRVKKKAFGYERQSSRSASPKMSPKQKARSLLGVSPSRSPMIPRPKNLFLFKGSGKDDLHTSPNTKPSFRLHRQFSLQAQRTPSTDSSLADISTPETPQQQQQQQQQGCGHRQYWRPGVAAAQQEGQGTGDDAKESYPFLKSPKLMTKTFSFLKKFPKEKSSSLERKRKSGINFVPPQDLAAKFPNSYSMDSFAVEKGSQSCGTPVRDTDNDWGDADVVPGVRLRSMSYLPPASPAIRIPYHSHHDSTSTTPAGTPTGHSFSPLRKMSSPQPPTESHSWRDEGGCWKECEARLMPSGLPPPPPREPPPPPAPHEPHYANLPHHSHDPDYMSMEEVRGAFRRISTTSVGESRRDSGGYLSMGEIRSFQRPCETTECPGCNRHTPNVSHHDCQPEQDTMAEDHEYMTMDDIQNVLHTEFPGICSSAEEKEVHKRCGFKSAPGSRKTSYCEGSDYLTPQEVGRMIRREIQAIQRGREVPAEPPHHFHSHQNPYESHHQHEVHHHQHDSHHISQEPNLHPHDPQHQQYHHH
ncbi:uncharacterized protein LOC135221669 isoform X2 [Macrobrachium nipponense]|uniref:uncharacterized protein LOC135221669 isoform X2 n=1 Tax=Macrobrachium nipponense TaxID=159736 RepID=UPI0030C80884